MKLIFDIFIYENNTLNDLLKKITYDSPKMKESRNGSDEIQ